VLGERCLPHSIFVNRYGRRFVNESSHNVANAFCERDGNELCNVPCWAIFDRQYRSRYAVLMTVLPKLPDPDWLVKEQTLTALARRVGIDPRGIEQTVARFNEFARSGKDLDFSRGDFAYDRYNGDPEAPHPNLGTIEKPPFYALPIYPSAVGTKGGPQTNVRGEVIDTHGAVVPGLYAAGNVMTAVFGPGTLAGGATLGVGMTWGYLCGAHAAQAVRTRKEGE
jgi:succinate dehydrogenase/fumarate reductase flavoprotein subunit